MIRKSSWEAVADMVFVSILECFRFVCIELRKCIGSMFLKGIDDRWICINFISCWVKVSNHWACPMAEALIMYLLFWY